MNIITLKIRVSFSFNTELVRILCFFGEKNIKKLQKFGNLSVINHTCHINIVETV